MYGRNRKKNKKKRIRTCISFRFQRIVGMLKVWSCKPKTEMNLKRIAENTSSRRISCAWAAFQLYNPYNSIMILTIT